MAWSGTKSGVTSLGPALQVAYWLVFLVVFLVAIYVALLDLRYTRMQFSQGEKELFDETLGDEEFRIALRDACSERRAPRDDLPPDD